LAEYTAKLSAIFEKHGTAAWYAHASVGCLHVRPVLNLRLEKDARDARHRREAFELVRGYRGSHSGEHGDGIVRSEFEKMFGVARAFEQVKDRFDPNGRYNPGKTCARPSSTTAASSATAGLSRGRSTAARLVGLSRRRRRFRARSRCGINGACARCGRADVPGYRVTRDERDVTRGRANAAPHHRQSPDALTSDEMRNDEAASPARPAGANARPRRHGAHEDEVQAAHHQAWARSATG
jgi:hypothetical protein